MWRTCKACLEDVNHIFFEIKVGHALFFALQNGGGRDAKHINVSKRISFYICDERVVTLILGEMSKRN